MTVKSLILLNALLFLGGTMVQAQTRIANYAYGTPGSDTYEQYSFGTSSGRRTTLRYTYGKDRKEVNLAYAGKYALKGEAGFKVRFPNKHTLFVIPAGDKLRVSPSMEKTGKTFAWEYEGPVNGIGTFCNVCAQDEKEAISLVKTAFLQR